VLHGDVGTSSMSSAVQSLEAPASPLVVTTAMASFAPRLK
jgi:hypothetical protein